MEHLFAYGSLQSQEVQETIYGRILKGQPETLVGYAESEISIEEEFGIVKYPIIKPTNNPNDTIKGVLYTLSEAELKLTDNYEGIHYKRIEVQLQSEQTAWAYSAKF
ncbi:gamma-glutamylcyclotransferase [Flavobacterium branchiophilum NBRC 15030 = ATCC 35035]|uniref:Gamma-glutamylcyclotransferase AIG2-like domain-containing protein n=2 Tax=Flavobacterium branchiophilum TaxID=55197 RepID=G2Z1Z3_FLABF|nr:gamma-glutamylcyclotransferase family protein [Flavobacterium branchiophilum]OXA79456.1 gamma-glutamylcyclotransferase [Flavobacterium branchiophilum NBRC 15030 = ATCC 35035]PDS24882.1 gamma-glutamylcyclotransferase [Flavobacterium branchiophilum]TQM42413.1 gamma-glutamylcyclotransferase (GGCT)/AIG2-like uncharacterized protein YtfP [Flavobacterium branchiophilum]CCB69931.1 Protein of unknown function [Flavobacterium branchiophilum FL-15]GEM54626.1 hypothetical protein FB1_08470 [Flavobacte